jgi:chemotaxis protein histidine kinase CheA
MSVVKQERAVILPLEISEAVNQLSVISFRLNYSSYDYQSLILQFRKQVKIICNAVDESIYTGLLDLVIVLDEGLDILLHSSHQPTSEQIDFLQGFPDLLLDYLNLPTSKIPVTILVKYFKNSQWVRPLTHDEYDIQMSYISHRADDVRHDEVLLEDILQLNAGASTEAHIDNIHNIDQEKGEVSTQEIEEVEIDQFLSGGMNEKESESEPEMSLDEIQAVGIDSDQTQDLELHQQELIDLVSAEFLEIDAACNRLSSFDSGELRQELISMTEQAENIGNAVNLIGLEGLGVASEIISSNLGLVSQEGYYISPELLSIIAEWPDKLSGYLKNIYSNNYVQLLITYLQDKNWPEPVNAELSEQLINKLSSPSFIEEEVESRQIKASSDDVSLELPVDVNQELLEGLLQDLPAQTEEFSKSIQNLCEGGGVDDIEVAQRVAHTLKGAANVVGVKGIANLTHHLEDILEAQVKSRALPVAELLDILVSASDCLEAMAEALLGIDAAPDDALKTFQSVLDWANSTDRKDTSHHEVKFESISDNQSSVENVTPSSDQHLKEFKLSEAMLRVPSSLADELLRLAGESLISSGQVQEHIKNVLKRQDAIQLHNQSLQQLSYDMEHLVDIQGVANQLNSESDENDFDPLELDQYNELHSISRRLIELSADSVQLTTTLGGDLSDLDNLVINQNQLQKESQELVLKTRMVPTKSIIPRIRRGVRQACRVTGKQVELLVEDNDTFMDSEVLNDLIEPLMHLIRNAVDHGIESSAERINSGKPETGIIRLNFSRLGDKISINIEDDGRGLDLDKIKFKAVSCGLIDSDFDMSDEAIFRFILEPGFSTRDEVTQVSGRGIGLDVVSVKIRELKGSISIQSEFGKNSRFELMLPVSSFSTHSLLVRIRQHIYAISNRGVEEILYPGLGELHEKDEGVVFKMEDDEYDVLMVDDLLSLPKDRRKLDRSHFPVLLIREESGDIKAVLVQEVIASRDVVVKPMGKYLPKLKGVAGATVLGDGSVAPVIDMPELLQHNVSEDTNLIDDNTVFSVEHNRLPYILVVDDSLSARQSLAQFVQDLGLDVRTARDGMEAVSLIEARRPDLILVDMEMPRMNGLELTSHIRASANTLETPVIMITSRSTDKHREAAIRKGVNHFMIKPFAEDELASYINEALKIA